jgi:hypothetical protein
MRTSLKAALVLGATPLVIGLAIFALWVLTRAEWLMGTGIVTMYGGVAVIVGAAVCLASYVWRSWRSRSVARGRLAWQTIGVLVLLLANFVAAGAAVFGAVMIEARYTVSVSNQSNVPLESARVEGGGVNMDLGIIAPGATIKRSFWIEHDGELVLNGMHGSRKVEASIDGYVTNNIGGDKLVVVEADGTVNVKDRRAKKPD